MAHRFSDRHNARTLATGMVLAAALVSLAGLAGCASKQGDKADRGAPDESVNSGLAALMRDSDIDTGSLPSGPPEEMTDAQFAAMVQRSALDLEKIFAQQAERANPPRPESPIGPSLADATANSASTQANQPTTPSFTLSDIAATPPTAPDSTPTTPDAAATASNPATQAVDTSVAAANPAATPDATAPVPPVAPNPAPNPALATLSPEDRILVETASRIIDLMKPPPLADGSQSPGMNEALALAAVESMKPGTLATIDDPNGPLAKGLSADRYASLRAARDRVAQNPAAAQGAAQQALTSLAPSLQMSSVRLCTRVMGFGRYDAYPSTDFPAGRSIRAIVYAQIDGFTPRPAKNSDPVQPNVALDDQKTVDLSQSLTLYHDSGTMQAWHRPFQRVVETSRDVRQDFYLIQQIELPKELPIGEYRLKVTVRDNTNGAEHETFLPLRVISGRSTMTDAR